MTCIIGLETPDGVWIGGDSAASGNWDTYRTRVPKVFRRGQFLIGWAGSFRMGQLLQYQLEVEEQTVEDDFEYLSTTFIDAIRLCLFNGGFAKKEHEEESGGQFLVGYRGRLYCVEGDYSVNSSIDGCMAIGCGGDYALGCLWRSVEIVGSLPESNIVTALDAASRFSNGVCPPYVIEFLERVQNEQQTD